MPLQQTSGAASYDAFGGGVAVLPKYIEEYFSTFLYQGTGASNTINNGIDLATKGGLVWTKARNLVEDHNLFDTARGVRTTLNSNTTAAQYQADPTYFLTAFNSNGFTMGLGDGNANGYNYTSWTLAKAPKFFDVVTYTGNGTNGRTVSHALGSVPGCIIVKRTDASNGWAVYHRSMNASPQDYMMRLNATDGAFTTTPSRWNNTLPTSTEFTLSGNDEVNGSGGTYVAYLFAHNAGGFGLTGTDNVISCGSFTAGTGSVNLGYEPQWIMFKGLTGSNGWIMFDTMRGWPTESPNKLLQAQSSAAEGDTYVNCQPTATGFNYNFSPDCIYIAIRRGPMKVPTSGTSVFTPSTVGASNNITVGFPADTAWFRYTGSDNWRCFDRLRSGYELATNLTDAEGTYNYYPTYLDWDSNSVWYQNLQNGPVVDYFFKRAPSFFDEVCYTGDGSLYQVLGYNLGVDPELILIKNRSSSSNWSAIFPKSGGGFNGLPLNSNVGGLVAYSFSVLSTTQIRVLDDPHTVSGVSIGADNTSGNKYVAYLFATCAGVSKVGSYTGTGTTLQVNCGFTGGARFVMIKRTDSTGSWYVWDVARGISSGNDPYLLLNSTAAEVTNTDYIDAYSAGFEISSTAPAEINASGGSFIFLAIS